MANIFLTINPTVAPKAICDLRESVGWERQEEDYPPALQGYWAIVGGFDAADTLIAWCAILSDRVRHAVLLDVIVHPFHQQQGIGKALVGKAVAHCKRHCISIIHVDFEPTTALFYERCGFRVGLGGIYEDSERQG